MKDDVDHCCFFAYSGEEPRVRYKVRRWGNFGRDANASLEIGRYFHFLYTPSERGSKPQFKMVILRVTQDNAVVASCFALSHDNDVVLRSCSSLSRGL